MNFVKWWDSFWFRESSYFDLAVVRILAVGVSLILLIDYTPGVIQSKLDMPANLYYPLPTLKLFMLPWGWGAQPDAGMVNFVYWITLISGFFSLAGFRTNISLFIFAIGSLFLQAFIYGFGDLHHRE